MDITIDVSELISFSVDIDRAAEVLGFEMKDAAEAALHRGIEYAAENAPVDNGDLRASIHVLEGPDADGGAYGTDLVYAWQREEGGTIVPRNAKTLAFMVGGQLVFAKSVTQTGSHYMQKSMESLEPELVTFYELAVDRTLEAVR